MIFFDRHMKANLNIRDMVLEDIPDVLEGERISHENPWSEGIFSGELRLARENPGERLLWVLSDDTGKTIMGHLCMMIIAGEATLNNITIYPEYRNKGMGSDFLTKAMSTAVDKGARAFTLEVRVSNTPALALYEKLGFKSEGIRRGYYDEPKEDANILWYYPFGENK